MSLDLNLIAAIVGDKDFLKVRLKGISKENIAGEAEVELWSFVENYYQEYGKTPDAIMILEKYGIDLPDNVGGLDYWSDEIKKRMLQESLTEAFAKMTALTQVDDPHSAFKFLIEFVKDENAKLTLSELNVKSIVDLKEEFVSQYFDAKSGVRGIDTPWKTLTDLTNGWYPKDLSFVIARPSVGKTWFMLCLARAAIASGKKVLFISCEMSLADLTSRFYAMEVKKPYYAIRKGRLGLNEEDHVIRQVIDYNPKGGLHFMDGERGVGIARIERAIQSSDADLVLIDSVYRIKPEKYVNRFENFAIVGEELKSFAQMYNKPIVASTQVNREGGKKKGEAMGQEDVAMSDTANWNATNVFGLNKDDAQPRQLAIHPVKVRESENEKVPLIVNWDFNRMCFDEIGPSNNPQVEEDENKGRYW